MEDSLYANKYLAELLNVIDSATFIDRNFLIQLDNNLSMLLIKGDTIIAALQEGEKQTDEIKQYTIHRSRIFNSFQDILATCNDHLDRSKSMSLAMTIGSLKFAQSLAESSLQEQITTMFELVNPVVNSGSLGLAELESDWQETEGQLATHIADFQKELKTVEKEILDFDDVCFKTVEELRAALLEEKIKRKKLLEEILNLISEIIVLKQGQEKRISKKHAIQIQELQDKNSFLVEKCMKLVQGILRVTTEFREQNEQNQSEINRLKNVEFDLLSSMKASLMQLHHEPL